MTTDFSSNAFIEFINDENNFDSSDTSLLHNMKGTAARLMLNVKEGEFDDIRQADPETLIQRHIEATGTSMSHNSQLTYKSRFNRAVNYFISHQNSAAGIETTAADLVSKRGSHVVMNLRKKPKPKSIKSFNEQTEKDIKNKDVYANPKRDTFSIPVLIRPSEGIAVEISGVPLDLTNEEAERIASILKVYARP